MSHNKDGRFRSDKTTKSMTNMGVSKNNGTSKSSILIGFSIINHPFWGTPKETPISAFVADNKKPAWQLKQIECSDRVVTPVADLHMELQSSELP